MNALAETLVTAFCHALGFEGRKRRPKVDVYELAERAGAEARIERGLHEDGRVEDSPLHTRILLWSSPAETRRRFTLGHELGHLVLSDPRVFRMVQLELGDKWLQVERLCDAFSAELLMPRRWVARRYVGTEEGFDVLRDLTHEADVSFSAGFIHLASVLHWRASLLYLRRDDWSCTVAAGPSQLADVEIDTHSMDFLRSLTVGHAGRRREELDSVSGNLVLHLWKGSHQISCELLPTRNGVWFLAVLPRPPKETGPANESWRDLLHVADDAWPEGDGERASERARPHTR
ncbi:MAG TPA: ImmA/IrrE family metallo-endopeptidase [Solirubrobacterales bacterium]|nr:ImmA/IrrE family metallo-endopeptidase [Solirubrobacterales bacterium]